MAHHQLCIIIIIIIPSSSGPNEVQIILHLV